MMLAFRVRLTKGRKSTQPWLRFDTAKLKDPDVADIFQATIGEKFAPTVGLRDDYTDIDTWSMILTWR